MIKSKEHFHSSRLTMIRSMIGLSAVAALAAFTVCAQGSDVSFVLPLPAPTNFLAVPNCQQIFLSWAGVAGAGSYDIYRGNDGNLSDATLLVRTDVTGYPDKSAIPGTIYYYWVIANPAIFSAPATATITEKPNTPSNLTATLTNSGPQIKLKWTPTGEQVYYTIERERIDGLEPHPHWEYLKTDVPVGDFIDNNPPKGATVKYRICASNSCSLSDPIESQEIDVPYK